MPNQTHQIKLSRCHLDDVFQEPPTGHRGMWTSTESAGYEVGDKLQFFLYNDVLMAEGTIYEILPPGVNYKADFKWRDWYKYLWKETSYHGLST